MLATRLPLATGWGGFISLVMFWALWTLINSPIDVDQRVETISLDFTRLIADSGITSRREKREEKVKRETRLAPPTVPEVTTTGDDRPVRTVRDLGPVINVDGRPDPIATSGSDHDAHPLVRFRPDYPPGQLHRGTEGWVQVQFSVTASGMVTDVQVVDSYPADVFDEATIEAVRRWRYSPRIVEGMPVERVGLQTVIVFELEE